MMVWNRKAYKTDAFDLAITKLQAPRSQIEWLGRHRTRRTDEERVNKIPSVPFR